MYNFDNYSHEYKTRRILDLDKILLDSTSLSSQLQDNSSIEIEFVPEFEGHLDHANPSQTEVSLEHHDYELFLPNQEIDTPSDNLSHQERQNCEQICQDDPFLTHATHLSLTFAIPDFMSQQNYEDVKPNDMPSTVPTFTIAYSGHVLNQSCAHNPFSSQVSQDKSSNSMASPFPNSGEHLLMESAGDIREENYPVHWLKFISSMRSKTEIPGPSIPGPAPIHVAYSPLTSMNHQQATTFMMDTPFLCPDAQGVHPTLSSPPLQPFV